MKITHDDIQTKWEAIVNQGFDNYNSLSREERVWFNVEPMITGGLFDHYVNSPGDRNIDTMDDLIYLGFKPLADLMIRMNELFGGNVPTDMIERNEIISNWPDGKYDDLIDELDDLFEDQSDKLDEALLNHILKTNIGN